MNAGSNSERPEGDPVSLWVPAAGITGYPVLRGGIEVDAAVTGPGIAGLTAALALKRAGQIMASLSGPTLAGIRPAIFSPSGLQPD